MGEFQGWNVNSVTVFFNGTLPVAPETKEREREREKGETAVLTPLGVCAVFALL